MSRLHRLRRRAAHSVATHERARNLAAARLAEALEPRQAAWLDEHLATCEACRSVAAAYEADRVALRALLERQPEPPRDLWARTAAAIEGESRSRGGRARRATPRRWSRFALGALSAVAVIAVVIGASVMSGIGGNRPSIALGPNSTPAQVALASPAGTPAPTPIAVGAGSVGWLGTGADGGLAYNVTKVNEVCPAERQPDCAPVTDRDSKPVDLTIRPKSISKSPVRNQAVVVGTDANGGDAVFVIALPTSAPSSSPTASAPPSPAATPTDQPTPAVTPTPLATPTFTPRPSSTPTVTPAPTPSIDASASPSVTPEPTVAATLAIVSDVTVVGQSAAYSPDGAWFAFSARPSDNSAGPDIYVWRVGDPLARAITTDHASVFASWAGGRLLGSRPIADATAGERSPESFFSDPASGLETVVDGSLWRPVVDPTDHWAVAWSGTVRASDDGLSTVPASGSLVLRAFTADIGLNPTNTSATRVADGTFAEFDVRWDETGQWLAVWLADASDPTIGRVSLFRLDRVTGQLDRPHGAPHDVTALPGFSIGNGRLAWATPPGQGGEGSRVQIVAWTADAVGAVESGPVEDVVVIH